MYLRLRVCTAAAPAFTFEHEGDAVHIGRDPSCELSLGKTAADAVSWKHAQLGLTPQGAFLRDLGSSNGTFLNEKRIEGRTAVCVGDKVRLGQSGPQLEIVELKLGEAAARSRSAPPERDKGSRPAGPMKMAVAAPPPPPAASATRQMLVQIQRGQRRLVGVGLAVGSLVLVVVACGIWAALKANGPDQSTDNSAEPVDRRPEPFHGDLYLLAVGVSNYKDTRYNLQCADKDAAQIVDAFKKQQTQLFGKVDAELVTNENARKGDILRKLEGLAGKVTQHDLVIVTLSGHGQKDKFDYFYFLPHDYNPDDVLANCAVSWDDFQRVLGRMPCHVLVVMDSCHSGTIVRTGLRSGDAQSDLQGSIGRSVQKFARSEKGMVVMAACMTDEKAQEKAEWGHGAMTLALLEGIGGKYLFGETKTTPLPRGKVVSLQDLDVFVTRRVKELVGSGQAIVTHHTKNVQLADIPISVIAPADR